MAAAVTGLQQAAASATLVMQSTCKLSPEPLAIQLGLVPPRVSAKFLAQQIEDSEDELIAGTGEGVQQQQQQQG